MKLKPPHKRHVKIPKKRIRARSQVEMTKAEKYIADAPCHYNASEASAWASGYNACLAAQADVPQSSQAWCQPMDNGKHTPRTFIIYFEDRDRGIMVFDREDVARQAFEQLDTNWNCYLFGAMPDTRPDRKCK
jgi:hypothetical protein